MGLIRASVVLAKFGMCLLVVAPLLALGVMAGLDRGPDGSLRGTVFAAALVLFDPLTWDCLRHSAVVAGIVSVGSFVLGVPTARVLVRWRFWGRNVLGTIVCAPSVFPPLLGAFGLRLLFGPEGPSPFRALEAPASQPWNWGIGGAWFCWIGTGLIVGVPLVAVATRGALERIDPSWEEAGRASGASSRRAWRTLAWSLVRPTALRAAALVFSVTLLEPGAPLILRLRGTLGYQIVEAATRSGSAPRAAVLSVLGLLCAATVLLIVRLLSGPSRLDLGATPIARPRRAPWWRAGLFVAGLGIGATLAWVPVLSVIAHAAPRGPWTISEVSGHVTRLIGAPMVRRALIDSAVVGIGAGTLGLVLAALCLANRPSLRAGRRLRARRIARLNRFVPPLVLGVGVLMIPRMLDALASSSLFHTTLGQGATRAIGGLARLLDPFRTPGTAAVLALALTRLPWLLAAIECVRGRRQPLLEETARTLGASRWRAWWDANGRRVFPPLVGSWLLAATMSAADAGALLVLSPRLAFRPLGPSVLDLVDAPDGQPVARVLAAVALVALTVAYLSTARTIRAALLRSVGP